MRPTPDIGCSAAEKGSEDLGVPGDEGRLAATRTIGQMKTIDKGAPKRTIQAST